MKSVRAKLFLCAVVCSAAVRGTEATLPAGVYRVGNGVTKPSVIHQVDTSYSTEAVKARLVGTVLLRAIVGIDGKPSDFEVRRGLGLDLDERAIEAVSNWQFGPGTKDGQPVKVRVQIEMSFALGDRDVQPARWHTAQVGFHLRKGSERPVIDTVVAPHVADGAPSATAKLTFDIDEKGDPVNIRSAKASDKDWARSATEALRQWKFTPASQNGNPVLVPCSMEFVRDN